MGRAERQRWEDNERVEELLKKDDLTDSERDELRKYTGSGGLVASGWDHGQFYTPDLIGEFIANVLDLPDGARVVDPQAGIGRLLWPYRDRCDVTAVEFDRRAAGALERLMPRAQVICSDVEDAALPKGTYDAVVANPPFGVKVQSQVPWGKQPYQRAMEPWTVYVSLQILKPGGIGAFIVPDNILSADKWGAFRKWTTEHALLRAVISLPPETFKAAGTSAKTSILFVQRPEAPVSAYGNYRLFMASVENIGWDSRGRLTGGGDLPTVLSEWRAMEGVPLRLPVPDAVPDTEPEADAPATPKAAASYVQSGLFE